MRIFRNVPVCMIAAVMAFGAASLAASLAASPARAAEETTNQGINGVPPDVTPEQLEAVKRMLQTNAEAKRALEARPELKEQIPPEIQKKLEGKEAEGEAAKKPAGPAPQEGPVSLPPYDWKKSVYIGSLFSKRLLASETGTLTHFGHEIFAPRPGGALILENMPVTGDYIVGPGDEIIVKLWGRMEGAYRLTVDRDGKIFVPKIGSLYVAGKTFSELKSFIRSKVSTTAEVSSDISLGQMKGIRVSVVGEARSPGWFNVSSLHTALQALSMAGGFAPSAYKKRVQVERLEGHVAKIVPDADADELEKSGKGFDLSDGDIVRVLPIVAADVNTVTLDW